MTTQYAEIPLSAQNQSVDVTLAGVNYTLAVMWCRPTAIWMLTINDASGNQLVGGIAMITGADLLAQYRYLNIGGSLVVQSDNDPAAAPTFESLGVTSHLYFITSGTNG